MSNSIVQLTTVEMKEGKWSDWVEGEGFVVRQRIVEKHSSTTTNAKGGADSVTKVRVDRTLEMEVKSKRNAKITTFRTCL